MKIKKFNVIAATALLGGTLLIPSAVGLLGKTLWQPLVSLNAAQQSVVQIIAGDKTATTAFASEGKHATTMAWRGRYGEVPGDTTLKKWVVGDRTYYEISGLINHKFRNLGATSAAAWGKYFACEVFFERGGTTYDQWILNPKESLNLHYTGPMIPDGKEYQTPLKNSRYQIRVDGDRVFISFWCHNSDTPKNIVFNYNDPTTPGGLSWVTTHVKTEGQSWNHHRPSEWNDL